MRISVCLFVLTCVLVSLIPESAETSCIHVELNLPLYWRVNPVIVEDDWSNAQTIDGICQMYETEMRKYSPSHWELYVADPNDPNAPQVQNFVKRNFSLTAPASTSLWYRDNRIEIFEVSYNPSFNWCWTVGTCGPVLDYSWQCAMTHEFGHAIGLLHCNDICDCQDWLNLPANQQVEQFPTMSSGNCYCLGFNCGYLWPATFLHDLAQADLDAIWELYHGGVVSIYQGSGDFDEPSYTIPTTFSIETVAPNPFNPRTMVWLDIPRAGGVTLAVHDLRGRLVRTLWSGQMDAGRHPVAWDGMNDGGAQAPSGIYLVRLVTADGQQRAVKVTLSK